MSTARDIFFSPSGEIGKVQFLPSPFFLLWSKGQLFACFPHQISGENIHRTGKKLACFRAKYRTRRFVASPVCPSPLPPPTVACMSKPVGILALHNTTYADP